MLRATKQQLNSVQFGMVYTVFRPNLMCQSWGSRCSVTSGSRCHNPLLLLSSWITFSQHDYIYIYKHQNSTYKCTKQTEMAVSQVKLKLLIDTHGKKVLFAEAGKDFVDFLIYLMSLPVSTIIKLLKEKGEVGCLNDLYNSLVNLNDTYIQSGLDRTTLLNHKSSLCLSGTPLLLSDAQSTSTARTVYLCRHCVARASELPNLKCPNCNYTMSTVVSIVSSTSSTTSSTSSPSKEGGFVKGVVTYMVMDNLEVTPMSTISSITMLSKFKVQNVAALKEKIVVFDVDEALKLLKVAMGSKNVLSTVFLGNVRA